MSLDGRGKKQIDLTHDQELARSSCFNPSRTRVCPQTQIDRQPHRCLELLALPIESGSRLGRPPSKRMRPSPQPADPQVQQVAVCCLQIPAPRRISDPDCAAAGSASISSANKILRSRKCPITSSDALPNIHFWRLNRSAGWRTGQAAACRFQKNSICLRSTLCATL